MLDKRTVVVDTDIGLRNLDVILGLENRIVYNLVDVINGNCRLKQALIKVKETSRTVSSAICADEGQVGSVTGADDQADRGTQGRV